MKRPRSGYIDYDKDGTPIVRRVPEGHALINRRTNVYFPENSEPGWNGIKLTGDWELIKLVEQENILIPHRTSGNKLEIFEGKIRSFLKRENLVYEAIEELNHSFAKVGVEIDSYEYLNSAIEFLENQIRFISEEINKFVSNGITFPGIYEVIKKFDEVKEVFNDIKETNPRSRFFNIQKPEFTFTILYNYLEKTLRDISNIYDTLPQYTFLPTSLSTFFYKKNRLFSRVYLEIVRYLRNYSLEVEKIFSDKNPEDFEAKKIFAKEYKRNIDLLFDVVKNDIPLIFAVEDLKQYGKKAVDAYFERFAIEFLDLILYSIGRPFSIKDVSSVNVEKKNRELILDVKLKNGDKYTIIKSQEKNLNPMFFPSEKNIFHYFSSDVGPFFIDGIAENYDLAFDVKVIEEKQQTPSETKDFSVSLVLRPFNYQFDSGLSKIVYIPQTKSEEKRDFGEIKAVAKSILDRTLHRILFSEMKAIFTGSGGHGLSNIFPGIIAEILSINGLINASSDWDDFYRRLYKSIAGRMYNLSSFEQKMLEKEIIDEKVYRKVPSAALLMLGINHSFKIMKILGIPQNVKVSVIKKEPNQIVFEQDKGVVLLSDTEKFIDFISSVNIVVSNLFQMNEEKISSNDLLLRLRQKAVFDDQNLQNAVVSVASRKYLEIPNMNKGEAYEEVFLDIFLEALKEYLGTNYYYNRFQGQYTKKNFDVVHFDLGGGKKIVFVNNPYKTGVSDITFLFVNDKTREVIPFCLELKARKEIVVPQIYSAREISMILNEVGARYFPGYVIYRPKLFGLGFFEEKQKGKKKYYPYTIDMTTETTETEKKQTLFKGDTYYFVKHYYHLFSPIYYQGLNIASPELKV